LRTHAARFAIQFEPTEGELFANNPSYLTFDLPFLFHVPAKAIRFARGAWDEIDVPDGQIGILIALEQRPTNVLTEDASVLGRGLVLIKKHLPLVDQVVLCNAGSEVPFFVRAYTYNPRLSTTVPPRFSLLIEEVDSIPWKMLYIERPANLGKKLNQLVNLATFD